MRFILGGEEIKDKKYRHAKIFLDYLVEIKHKEEEVLLIGNLSWYSTITDMVVDYLKLCGLKEEADKLSKIDEDCKKKNWQIVNKKIKSLVKQRDFLLKSLGIEVCSYATQSNLRDEGLFNLDLEDHDLWRKLDLLPE